MRGKAFERGAERGEILSHAYDWRSGCGELRRYEFVGRCFEPLARRAPGVWPVCRRKISKK